eukprot:TRINITY_DN9498_c0_g1_i1.p1 TRINITY_DN9498_c0_g1~~TRINITY_DN9498_c0_g1_i1.p1  ORF type:complete len:361 (+),score=44.33 TRINITY_DN9498_c0_g1_i1:89-1171(+)
MNQGSFVILFLVIQFLPYVTSQSPYTFSPDVGPSELDPVYLQYYSPITLIAYISFQAFDLRSNLTIIEFTLLSPWPYQGTTGNLTSAPDRFANPPNITKLNTTCPPPQTCVQVWRLVIDPRPRDNSTSCRASGAYQLAINVGCRNTTDPGCVFSRNLNPTNGTGDIAIVTGTIETEDFCYVLRFGAGLELNVQSFLDPSFTNDSLRTAFLNGSTVYVLASLGAINGVIQSIVFSFISIRINNSLELILWANGMRQAPYGEASDIVILPQISATSVAFSFNLAVSYLIPPPDGFLNVEIIVNLNVTVAPNSKKKNRFICCAKQAEKQNSTSIVIQNNSCARVGSEIWMLGLSLFMFLFLRL